MTPSPRTPRPGPSFLRREAAVVAAVSLGGGLGAAARHGASLAWPAHGSAFPWTTLAVNALGCALIGVLMTVLARVRATHPLVRPFLGTGVLGGFTTFSAFAADGHGLLADGHARLGLAYLAATPVVAVAAAWGAAALTRRLAARTVREAR
ncbi:CrcB family protein [Actinomadura sp. WMMB 499]|uniref:fluoride efflux transporter FluC n=1 Tax=Actinomadura sp. WMMB 499 TaxID=1219491 RepID=UPI001C3F6F50|nr:CrcB family protein [Actinomadura sp. WMMB 499]